MLQEYSWASLPCCERRLLWHMRLHKGKPLGNGTKPQVSIREKGRVKTNFLHELPPSQERERNSATCTVHHEIEYAPVNHLLVALHARICHPNIWKAEYPSAFLSLNTVITSQRMDRSDIPQHLPPVSYTAGKTTHMRAMAPTWYSETEYPFKAGEILI